MNQKNVFGLPLETCSTEPLTGFFRDGCCNTDAEDIGEHTVCVIVTEEFLEFSKKMGNDLSTPMPQFGFKGLKPGDRWCLCAERWRQALNHNKAPKVVLEATNEEALNAVSFEDLIAYAFKNVAK